MNKEKLKYVALRVWQLSRVYAKKLTPIYILFIVLGIPIIVAVTVYNVLSPKTWLERLVSVIVSFVMWLITTRVVTDVVIFIKER